METIKKVSAPLFAILIFWSNLIPIIGPSLFSSGIGFNQKRFESRYEINKKLLLLAILIGNLAFSFFAGITINYLFEFVNQIYFWIIISSGFLINQAFSTIFYFIGKKRYAKKIS